MKKTSFENEVDKLLANVGDIALRSRSRAIFLALEPSVDDKILEVGCGDGFYQYILSSLNKKLQLVGVDVNPNAIDSAKRNLKGKRVKFLVNNAVSLPFKSGSFDKIIMSEVLEHIEKDIDALKEAYRVLKSRGTILITVPNENYPFLWDPINWILERTFGYKMQEGLWGIWAQHLRLYKPLDLKRKVEKIGFRVEEIKSLTRWSLPFNHYLITLGAMALVGGKTSVGTRKQVSKFSKPTEQKKGIMKLFFDVSNFIDKFNKNESANKTSVGIFVKAVK